jgi:hypothetical protein
MVLRSLLETEVAFDEGPILRSAATLFLRLFVRDLRESVLKILPAEGETPSAYRQGKRRSRGGRASQQFEARC